MGRSRGRRNKGQIQIMEKTERKRDRETGREGEMKDRQKKMTEKRGGGGSG